MENFKGTQGELELKFVSGICIGIGTIGDYSQITANTILPETDKEYEKEKKEILSNMKLYAASPEMLKMLNDILEQENLSQSATDCIIELIKKAIE